MRCRFALLFFALFAFTGCGEAVKERDVVSPGLDAGAIIAGPTTEGHVYAEYGPGADRFPPPRVLFFSSDDPFSATIDTALQQIYGSGGVTASTFRAEFDTATGARLKYRVLVPGSIVIVTESGSTVEVHPSPENLRQLLLPTPLPSPSLT